MESAWLRDLNGNLLLPQPDQFISLPRAGEYVLFNGDVERLRDFSISDSPIRGQRPLTWIFEKPLKVSVNFQRSPKQGPRITSEGKGWSYKAMGTFRQISGSF